MKSLRGGAFLDRRENVPVFGKPGLGEDARPVRLVRATGSAGPPGLLRLVQPSGAGPPGDQTRFEAVECS